MPLNVMELLPAPERAKAQIIELIRTGEIPCGQRIDQRILAKRLNLTTAPLREALSSLENAGLLQRIPGLGIFCKAYTVDEIEELIEIRGALEAVAAARAAFRISVKEKGKLMEMARKLSDAGTFENAKEFLEEHIAFHRFIAEISHSDNLLRLLDNNHIIQQVLSNISATIWPVEPHDHLKIAEAICSGEPETAEQVVRQHIAPTFQERLRALRLKYGDKPVI